MFFSSYLQEQLPLLAVLVTKRLGGAHVYTGQKRPVTETPMFTPQLLCIYHLVIEPSHHGLSLEPLRPSQHHHFGVVEPQNRSTGPLYPPLPITSQQDAQRLLSLASRVE